MTRGAGCLFAVPRAARYGECGMSIFKAYDVRGTVPEQLNPDVAYRFGVAAAKYFQQPEAIVTKYVIIPVCGSWVARIELIRFRS